MVQLTKRQVAVQGEGDEELIACPAGASRHLQTLI